MSVLLKPEHRLVVKIAGESGQGVNSVGEIVAKSLKESGHFVFGYREYPSLIKGGYSSYQVDIGNNFIRSSSSHADLLCCLSRNAVHAYLPSIRQNGQLLHILKAMVFTPAEQQLIVERNIRVEYIDAVQIARELGGTWIMSNTVVTGVLLKLLGLSESVVTRVLQEEFAKKPEVLAKNIACLQAGQNAPLQVLTPPSVPQNIKPQLGEAYLMTGNHGIALGAVAAGVRAYYAYPMTPASSILTFLANWAHQTGMLVRQVEDEISVAQMALGSMFMGTRALCGTSGGGFDLMTESVSMAGITETPFVCVLGQRPGPATGLPTWTSAGDLNLAVYGGHGEYPRCVLAASDLETAYLLVGEAFNIAEKYQLPVILLTEKQIAESLYCIESFPAPAAIDRSLVEPEKFAELKPDDRFAITDSGISSRWLPGQSPATFDANTDEHLPNGDLTEEADTAQAMNDKRLRKQVSLSAELPEPTYYGEDQPDLVLVGWGSTKGTVLDAVDILKLELPTKKIGYVHYDYVYPVKTELIEELYKDLGDKLILVEGNAYGQLGALITQATGIQFSKKLLKYNGRPFFVEDILEYVTTQLNG